MKSIGFRSSELVRPPQRTLYCATSVMAVRSGSARTCLEPPPLMKTQPILSRRASISTTVRRNSSIDGASGMSARRTPSAVRRRTTRGRRSRRLGRRPARPPRCRRPWCRRRTSRTGSGLRQGRLPACSRRRVARHRTSSPWQATTASSSRFRRISSGTISHLRGLTQKVERRKSNCIRKLQQCRDDSCVIACFRLSLTHRHPVQQHGKSPWRPRSGAAIQPAVAITSSAGPPRRTG